MSTLDAVANKQSLISSDLDPDDDEQPADSSVTTPQRKCGVHKLGEAAADQQHKVTVTKKKRSVDAVVEAYLDEHPAFLNDYVSETDRAIDLVLIISLCRYVGR